MRASRIALTLVASAPIALFAADASAFGAGAGRPGFAGAPAFGGHIPRAGAFGGYGRRNSVGPVVGNIGPLSFGARRAGFVGRINRLGGVPNYYPSGPFGPFVGPYGPAGTAPVANVAAASAFASSPPRFGPPSYGEPGYRAHPVLYHIEPASRRARRTADGTPWPKVTPYRF